MTELEQDYYLIDLERSVGLVYQQQAESTLPTGHQMIAIRF